MSEHEALMAKLKGESKNMEEIVSENNSVCSYVSSYMTTPSEIAYVFGEHMSPLKQAKRHHYRAEIIVEIEDRDGNLVPICALLLDTGTSTTILLREFVRKGRAKSHKGQRMTWSTFGGKFTTQQESSAGFFLALIL